MKKYDVIQKFLGDIFPKKIVIIYTDFKDAFVEVNDEKYIVWVSPNPITVTGTKRYLAIGITAIRFNDKKSDIDMDNVLPEFYIPIDKILKWDKEKKVLVKEMNKETIKKIKQYLKKKK